MQDKDFDQLFKDRFEEAELQPSSNLWDKIEGSLVPEKKRSFPVYWAAAAIIVILAGITLLSSKTEKMQLQGNTLTAESNPAGETNGSTGTRTEAVTENIATESKSTPLVLAPKLKLENLVTRNKVLVVPSKETVKRQESNVTAPLPVKEVLMPEVQEQTEIMMAKADVPVHDNEIVHDIDIEDRPRKGIRNAGDVINFIVDKFDKREKKIIQFKTDDDDNSSLIAVNIGILKFNPKRNKQN